MTATILRADARNLPLADNSVDLIVTSPPYFALRSYTDGGEHYDGQIGSEATPAEFIEALLTCTREWMRVLKPSGSLWVNLGDKYDSGTTAPRGNSGDRMGDGRQRQSWNATSTSSERATMGRAKSLFGLPWRYALACIDELGLILRAEVIWSKPNGLPESVRDRVRRSHETWFHFTLQPRYFSAVDEIREAHMFPAQTRTKGRSMNGGLASGGPNARADTATECNPLGKLPGSVWEVATEPLTVPDHLGVDHFAAFPTEWPRRIILGWSPSGVCTACGEGRRPVADKQLNTIHHETRKKNARGGPAHLNASHDLEAGKTALVGYHSVTITGYVCDCAEPTAPTRPAVVLDPFGGTGTTALVASVLGRHGISVDMSADYCRLAAWRTTDPGQRAKAMRVEKPEPVHEAQLSLLEGIL